MFNSAKKQKKNIFIITIIAFILGLILLPQISWAACEAPASGFLKGLSRSCYCEGDCEPCDLLQILVTIGQFIMGIAGSLTLLFFIYGGFLWLTSGGKESQIATGKKIFINSLIRLLIVMFAYVFISGAITLFAGSSFGDWQSICS